MNENLTRLIEEAKIKFEAMTPAEREEMLRLQRESWVRGEMGMPKPRFRWINGVKVYDSYGDYCFD